MSDDATPSSSGDARDTELSELLRRLANHDGDSSPSSRYQHVEEIARGGMGVIYEVRDVEMRRRLAMKVLQAKPVDGGSEATTRAARFVEEAQVTGQLDHPGIIPVHEMGLDSQGRLFFTMRLVRGRTLGEVFAAVRAGDARWTRTRALTVMVKVCEAMAYAHHKDVIHRDLKPANIMVGRFGETYVMDWGLSKLIDGSPEALASEATLVSLLSTARQDDDGSGSSSYATLEGDVMGTPAYMAPEQAHGRLEALGPAADIYAAGSMLYELLSGHPPYGEVRRNAREVLSLLRAGPPAPLSERAPAEPAELTAICDKAMARDALDRYRTMEEMAEDLHAFLDGRVVRAHQTGALVEARKWITRNKALASALLVALLAALGGLGAVGWIQKRSADELGTKNDQLQQTNDALGQANDDLASANQRAAAFNNALEDTNARLEEVSDAAVAARERAEASEAEAIALRETAEWDSYRANLSSTVASFSIGNSQQAAQHLADCAPHLRGWEWRYLQAKLEASTLVLSDARTWIFAVALSPDGSLVAGAGGSYGDIGEQDSTVRIWDAQTGELLRLIEGHHRPVQGLDFSPDGRRLAVSAVDQITDVFDVETGALLAAYDGVGGVTAFHPSGRWVAAGNWDGELVLWDSEGTLHARRADLPSGVTSLAFSPDGGTLAVGCTDLAVVLLGTERLLVQRRIDDAVRPSHAGSISTAGSPLEEGARSLAYSADGSWLASGSSDGLIRLWETGGSEPPALLHGHGGTVRGLAFHPLLPLLASADATGSVRWWLLGDRNSGPTALDILHGHDGTVHDLAISADGRLLATSGSDATVRIWNATPGAVDMVLAGTLLANNYRPYELAFSPDSRLLAWRSAMNELRLTDAYTGEHLTTLHTFDSNFDSVAELAFLDEQRVMVLSGDGRRTVQDLQLGRAVESTQLDRTGRYTRISPSRRLIAFFGRDAAYVAEADAKLGEWIHELHLPNGASKFAFSADESTLVTGDHDGLLVAWNLETGEPLWTAQIPGEVMGLEVSPQGRHVFATTYDTFDQTLYVHDLDTGERLAAHEGPTQPAYLAVSPDGRRVIGADWEGSVSLWDPERGHVVSLASHSSTSDVAFSPDGQSIASAGVDGRVIIRHASPASERAAARDQAAQRLASVKDVQTRVDTLYERHLSCGDVIEALQEDRSLDEPSRDAAIRLARVRSRSQDLELTLALQVVVDETSEPAQHLEALDVAEEALRWFPDHVRGQVARAGAQTRLGMHAAAWSTLQRIDPSAIEAGDEPARPALTASVLAELGREDEARAALIEAQRDLDSAWVEHEFQRPPVGVPWGEAFERNERHLQLLRTLLDKLEEGL